MSDSFFMFEIRVGPDIRQCRIIRPDFSFCRISGMPDYPAGGRRISGIRQLPDIRPDIRHPAYFMKNIRHPAVAGYPAIRPGFE